MTNTAKVLITGTLLVGLCFGSYLLFFQDDESSVEADVAAASAAKTPVVEAQSEDDAHMAAGSVVHATPPSTSASAVARIPQPVAVPNVMLESAPADTKIANGSRSESPPHRQPARTLQSADVRSAGAKANSVPRIERAPDDSKGRGSNPVAAAMTEALVKESAQLDPSLPPPDGPVPDGQDRRGSNAVAAAMTEQLVRESTRLNPAPQPANRPSTQ